VFVDVYVGGRLCFMCDVSSSRCVCVCACECVCECVISHTGLAGSSKQCRECSA